MDFVVVARGEQELLRTCLAKQGFTYFVDVPAERGAGGDRRAARLGSDDVDRARRVGFGLGDAASRPADRNAAYVASLNAAQRAAYQRAVFGDPADAVTVDLPGGGRVGTGRSGCLAAARTALYGDLAMWLRVSTTVQNLDREVLPAVAADLGYQRALGDWRACMAGRGLPFDQPASVWTAAGAAYATASPRQARETETALAVAAAHCSASSGLAAVGRDLNAAYQRRAEARHVADVQAYRAMLAGAAVKARQLPSAATAEPVAAVGAGTLSYPPYINVNPGQCELGYMCAYYFDNFHGCCGLNVGFFGDNKDWGAIGSFSGINNNSRSWANTGFTSSYADVEIADGYDMTGTSICLENGTWLGYYQPLRDKVSSNHWWNLC